MGAQVSFVNSICTIKGGTHVNAVADDLAKKLLEKVTKKNKSANLKPFQVPTFAPSFVPACAGSLYFFYFTLVRGFPPCPCQNPAADERCAVLFEWNRSRATCGCS